MLYPVMPVFLKSIGFSVLLIGVLEGIAEATAGLSKGYFGKLSDDSGKRLPFIRWGYFLAAAAKPLMALSALPAWIFGARTMDRLGKGLRTGARDAMLSDQTTPENKGAVFGFHRGMDTLGACIGPAISLLLIGFFHRSYQQLFMVAFVPGLLSTLLLYLLKEKPKATKVARPNNKNLSSFFSYWQISNKEYKKVVIGLLLFTLFNSSDYFLLLQMKLKGLTDSTIIGVYIFYNLVYALLSFPLGKLGDKIGLKNVLMLSFVLFAIVYGGMALSSSMTVYFILFFIYGAYAAAGDGIATALLSNLCRKEQTGTALGSFKAMQSIFTMFASFMCGFIVFKWNYGAAFALTAIVSVLVFIYFLFLGKLQNARPKDIY